MRKLFYVTTAAVVCAASPALANDSDPSSDVSTEIEYSNRIDTAIVTRDRQTSDIELVGTVRVRGLIDVDSSANAISDLKQRIRRNHVEIDSIPGRFLDPTDTGSDLNDSRVVDVDVSGNAGINSASGYYNAQANIGTIAVTDDDDNGNDDNDDGMARANTTGLQDIVGNRYGDYSLGEDRGFENRNTSIVNGVTGDGNIGVNSAAGAFNAQANVMTIALAEDAVLADATSGVLQMVAYNSLEAHDTSNRSRVVNVSGSGNFGVNSAAGYGNAQFNSLTIAAADSNGN